jgi:glycolate oxidase FAD binding subunit
MTSSTISRSIEAIVGTEHLEESPGITLDGHRPVLLVRPGSHEEVRECLKLCSEANLAVVPAGLMSWVESGNPLRCADVLLSLARMARIIDYSPADLTVVAEAGLTIKELYRATEPERQWLPLDPPGAARSTVGAVASCASSGPLRLGFGTPRDYVIGLRLAHADGSESKSGGRVVKNVAGYDMNKLYIGSFGTLAVVTGLTFKLRPLPDSSSTVIVPSQNLRPLAEAARGILAMDLMPVSVLLAKGVYKDDAGSRSGDWVLAIRLIENETAVSYQKDRIEELLGSNASYSSLAGDLERAIWEQIADIDNLGEVCIKISLPLSEVLQASENMISSVAGCAASVDAGVGIIRLAFDAEERRAIEIIERLRAEALALGGTLVIERAATDIRRQADGWGDLGPTASLMKSIKDKLDPQEILSPGRFDWGIQRARTKDDLL